MMVAPVSRKLVDQWPIVAALLATSILYVLAMAAFELEARERFVRAGSLLELSTELLSLAGLSLGITQLTSNWSNPRLRRGWMLGTTAMALLAVGEATDWLSVAGEVWDEDYRYKLPLWIGAATALYLCTRLYRTSLWVRRFLVAGLAVQSISNLLDLIDGNSFRLQLADQKTLECLIELTELLSLECYISALLLTFLDPQDPGWRRRPSFGGPAAALAGGSVSPPRANTPVALGTRARAMFFERDMFRAPRYPTRYRFLHQPGLRQAVTLAIAVLYGCRVGPRVHRAGLRSIFRQFGDLLALGIGHGVDAISYYLYELYRPGGRTEAAYYLTRYETKNGLFTVLNARHPRHDGIPYDMTDKAVFRAACIRASIPTPPILLTASDGTVEWHVPKTALDRDLFAKLKRGRGTKTTSQFHRVAPLAYLDRDERYITLADIVEELRLQSLIIGHNKKTTPYIIQPRLRNHASLADLATDSLVVIRIVTCLNKADEPEITHAMLRILTKIEPGWDTSPDAEYGAAINLATGRLGQLTGDKPDSCVAWHDVHPVTGARILGREIESWPALADLALRAHGVFRSRIVVGWDLALTASGPMVIEGNSNMDVSFIQRAYRDPIGRSRLGDLLDHHLSALDRSVN